MGGNPFQLDVKLGGQRNYHEGQAIKDTMLTSTPVPFNQEKALVGAFFVIVQLCRLIVCSTNFKSNLSRGNPVPDT